METRIRRWNKARSWRVKIFVTSLSDKAFSQCGAVCGITTDLHRTELPELGFGHNFQLRMYIDDPI